MRYEAYNIHTQETVAESDTIYELADSLFITRQTASRHIRTNMTRATKPMTLPGGIVLRDTRTTDRFQRPTERHTTGQRLYIYKASTGEYITEVDSIQTIAHALMIRPGAIATAVDRWPLYKHNIVILSDKAEEPVFITDRRVHEVFTPDLKRVISTWWPEKIPQEIAWKINPYKDNQYMAIIPGNWDNPTVDYNENPEDYFFLDNDNNIE